MVETFMFGVFALLHPTTQGVGAFIIDLALVVVFAYIVKRTFDSHEAVLRFLQHGLDLVRHALDIVERLLASLIRALRSKATKKTPKKKKKKDGKKAKKAQKKVQRRARSNRK